MIGIVDYGMGNLGSISNMLKAVGARAEIVSNAQTLKECEKIILPGVGAFDAAVKRLHEAGFWDVLNQRVIEDKVPALGVCLGMQLITKGSEEGKLEGFGWIPARAKRFPKREKLKVPHMGWNWTKPMKSHPLIQSLPDLARFYFVHSYFVEVEDSKDSLLRTTYGHEFDSGIVRNNVAGFQFHPEKSHKFGMALFKEFAAL